MEAVRRLKVKSVLLDGEGIVYDQHGMPSFDLIHSKQYDREVSLVAFDLLELDGDDVRRQPLLDRKARLAKLVAKVRDGIEFNEHIEGDGAVIFQHACHLGHEGIVAKCASSCAMRPRIGSSCTLVWLQPPQLVCVVTTAAVQSP